MKIILAALTAVALVACGAPRDEREIKAEAWVKSVLKDPDSAKFSGQHGYCGYVNAKNSFGGYTGDKRFVAPDAYNVMIEGRGTRELERELWQREFDKDWAKYCQ